MAIKFEVPYNGTDEIIELYLQNKKYIFMVYGRAEDGYPQGRKTKNLPPITLQTLLKHVKQLKKARIEFNYLLNGSCFGNREYNKEYQKNFLRHIKNLYKNGITTVTLGNIYLIELVANEIPEMKIFGSVILEVDCLSRLEKLASMNIKYICLSKTLLKNFVALKNIQQFLKDKNIKPVLLSNDPCLHHCALTSYHNNVLSHQTGGGPEAPSYCRLHCTREFLRSPHKYISASFIRPEDLTIYEKMGYNIFKLCDRKQTTEWIGRVLKAYINHSYKGNLADLMAPWNKLSGEYFNPKTINIDDIRKKGIDSLKNELRFTPYIDNNKLEGYLKFWENKKPHGCGDKNCQLCGYCQRLADRAVTIDKQDVIVKNIDIALDFLVSLN